jgi:hypothetical protein
MTILDRITESVELQMELSRLLFEILWPKKCWHEGTQRGDSILIPLYSNCSKCRVRIWTEGGNPRDFFLNPNLFIPESFLTVYKEAVKLDGFKKRFGVMPAWDDFIGIHAEYMESPHFPYEVLKWLNPEGLAEVMEGGGECTTGI